MNIQTSTGNPIVDQVGKMNITGNVIPEAWYKTIVNSKGKPNFIAISLLSEIVYWYRPTEVRDEYSNDVTYNKKFYDADFLQKSYSQIRDKFQITDKQIREALKLLEQLGVVKRIFRTVQTPYGAMFNVMYLELIPSALEKLTFIDDNVCGEEGVSKKGNTSSKEKKLVSTRKSVPTVSSENTNTKTTAEISSETTTTTDVVADLKPILEKYDLDEGALTKILMEANYDTDRVVKAVQVLENYRKPINSTVGFLIEAIRKNYKNIPASNKKKAGFDNFHQRDYDYDALQAEIVGS